MTFNDLLALHVLALTAVAAVGECYCNGCCCGCARLVSAGYVLPLLFVAFVSRAPIVTVWWCQTVASAY
jgi:hypothetical protein